MDTLVLDKKQMVMREHVGKANLNGVEFSMAISLRKEMGIEDQNGGMFLMTWERLFDLAVEEGFIVIENGNQNDD